jgi:predicted RNase H-like nuclease (RuvC/YqgF family)
VGSAVGPHLHPSAPSSDRASLSLVLTPSEADALRAERDAAEVVKQSLTTELEKLRRKYKDDMHAALVEVGKWSWRSGSLEAELTTLRAEVEKLKRLLEECANDLAMEIDSRYPNAGQHPSEAKRRDRDMEIVNLARAELNPEPANAVEVPE